MARVPISGLVRAAIEDRAVRTQGQKSQRAKSNMTLCILGALDDESMEFSVQAGC
jgi:hypothetical protein